MHRGDRCFAQTISFGIERNHRNLIESLVLNQKKKKSH